MSKFARLIAIFTLLGAVGAVASPAFAAEGQWAKDHPRRAEVNHRLDNQSRRIHRDVRKGELTHAQAAQLHHQDRQIRHEERAMARQNGGHLTRAEQHVLNRQENAVSHEIPR